MTANDIRILMRARFKSPEHAIMFEVGNSTGLRCSRHADAVTMSLYPSRGLEIEGYEIKVSRSDWTRELKTPDKAETIAAYCDRWWVVTPKGLVRDGELPAGWGLMEATDSLRVSVRAPKQEVIKPVDRAFIGAMLRRASEADENAIAAAVRARTADLEKSQDDRIEGAVKLRTSSLRRELEEAKETIRAFEQASGISISRYSATATGQAYKVALALAGNHGPTLQNAVSAARRFLSNAEALLPNLSGQS